MDKITRNLLSNFGEEQTLNLQEPELFENFCNYCILASEYSDEINLEDVWVSGGNDTGIDGLAIILNGDLITSEEEINDICDDAKNIEAAFIFIQAKTSSNFDGGEIGNFAFGVKDFFSEHPKLPRNDKIAERVAFQESIYEKSGMFRDKPSLKMFYVTTGRWDEPEALRGRINSEIHDLEQTNLFSNVEFSPVDADGIQKLYHKSKNRVSTEINFPNRSVLPDIEGVKEAYLGIIPAKEYLKLLANDLGFINKNLFFDNVRDFLGTNEVNDEIRETILSNHQDRFGILNNGVTVVAQSVRSVGNKFMVGDYQIVNGCQTSHILFEFRSQISDSMFLPLKLIVSGNEEVINTIIKGTNRQNSVAIEEFLALSDFNKKLEAFYNSFEPPKRLYYERRPKQYNGMGGIEKVRIVSIPMQIRYFASMFLDQPHRAGRHYKSLLAQVNKQIFIKDQSLHPYYVSAFASYKLTSAFRNFSVESRFRPAKYHILMATRLLAGGASMPAMQANKMQKYCEKVLEVLQDPNKSLQIFRQAIELIDKVTNGEFNRDSIRSPSITQSIKNHLTS